MNTFIKIKKNTKKFLKRNFSEKFYIEIVKFYVIFFQKIAILIQNPKDRIRLLKFKKPFFYNVFFKNINFDILINKNNGMVDNEIFLQGAYEKKTLNLFFEEVKLGDVFVDIGANIGQHSLFASYLVGENGKVIAFEPLQSIYNQFNKSIEKNNLKNIVVYNNGCGSKEEIIPIYSTKENMGSSSVLYSPDKKKNGEIKIIIPDNILKNEDRIDFIKIDVEGYELEVLKGLEKTIKKFHPKIFIEYSPYYYELKDKNINKEIIDFLLDNHYKIIDVENGNREIDKNSFYKLEKEKLEQTNFFCV